MEEEIDRRRRDEGKKMTSTTVVLNRRLVAASAMEGELRRGRGWSVWSGGRDCARGDVAGRWRADVWNILGGGLGGGGFGYGGVYPEHALSLP